MTKQIATFYPTGINTYVPGMQFAEDVHYDLVRVDFGTPAVASATVYLNSAAITNAASTIVTGMPITVDARYGRAIQIKGDTAGDNAVVTVSGRDYLQQPMTEAFTLNGTTAVLGQKAFKFIDSVAVGAGNANASSSIDLGSQDALGLPYKSIKVLSEENDAAIVATLGTLVTPTLTDPATTTTDDVRGTYDPQTTLNGARRITGNFLVDRTINAAGNGGLHGIRQV